MAFRRRAVLAQLMLSPLAALAQSWPDRPLRMIVPYPPGGGGDAITRVLSEGLSKRLGQSVIVDNRPGADSVIGTQSLVQSAPDGYTMMLAGDTMVGQAAFERKAPYDPFTQITPVGKVADVPVMLIVNPNIGVKNLPELIALARSQPGGLKAGHTGGSSLHLMCLKQLEHLTGTRFLAVPYRGTAPTTIAVASGEIDMVFAGVSTAVPLIDAGKVLGFGVSGKTRSGGAPNIPTMIEAGVPGFDMTIPFYVFVPGATPAPVIDRLDRELRALLEDGAMRKRLTGMGFDVATKGHADCVLERRQAYEGYRQLIQALNLKYSD
jgi:tripartite-type tricarboxylate transporter receptor subunit TctC